MHWPFSFIDQARSSTRNADAITLPLLPSNFDLTAIPLRTFDFRNLLAGISPLAFSKWASNKTRQGTVH